MKQCNATELGAPKEMVCERLVSLVVFHHLEPVVCFEKGHIIGCGRLLVAGEACNVVVGHIKHAVHQTLVAL
jgi:hypothetical protein